MIPPNVEEINDDCLTEKIVHLNLRRLLTDLTFMCFLACQASSCQCSSLVVKCISRKDHWENRVEIGACNYDLGVFGVCEKNVLSRELDMNLHWKKKHM